MPHKSKIWLKLASLILNKDCNVKKKATLLFGIVGRNCATIHYYVQIDLEMTSVVSRKKAPMGVALYKSVEEGGGRSFECFRTEAPMSCLQRLDALDPNNWANNNVQRGATSGFKVRRRDDTQYSERHYMSP